MIKTKPMHHWTPTEVYQAYVDELLRNNPGTVKLVETRGKPTKARKTGRRVVRKRIVGGYWAKRNQKKDITNYWVYTTLKDGKVVEVINYDRWMNVMNAYFGKARKMIIQGCALHMMGSLGRIEPRCIERNHSNRRINWHETKKQPLVSAGDGKMRYEHIIYFNEDSYVRIGWVKTRRITGERSYEFQPSGNNINGNGFVQEFSRANKMNPALQLNYPYYPYNMDVA